ncbi:MAG TPA: N-acetylglucosamine-specific PTS transporter subunit IIBC [Caulobacteraceae bacterium]|jgi:PTS system N-acetylglucosamine-specific IIC component|nr:N-acetylglucosamine-specific PTS transporter subunit IIBC [Caulobacteraceae bacterium]
MKLTDAVGALQPLGRALMLPIAVLPVAGLLLRLGQPDLLAIPFVAAAGDAIFHNLGLIFAIGVAVGLAKDGNGAAGLAGAVCFLIASNGAQALMAVPPDAIAGLSGKSVDLAGAAFKASAIFRLSVPLGILSGLIAGDFYNRFGAMKLPEYLAFFGGRRFVPIVSGFAGLALALAFGLGWSSLSRGIDGLSHGIVAAGPLGLFAYGVLNRLLIVTGLHHILNNVAWFIIGDFHGQTGDLNRFFAGDSTAGAFMSGFFPVMMFGLPAACLAMWRSARPERRTAVGGMLGSLALTSFLTGVTEPIEFSFMFLAPALFAIHAVLTGLSMVLMDALHVRLGFSFSAGLFDYVINFGKATQPWLLLPVGLGYFGVYYAVFRFAIVRFDLKTPGREPLDEAAPAPVLTGDRPRARGFIEALGGAANLASVDACTTRLRLVVADQAAVDEPALKALGALGVVRPSARDLQVVLGPIADEMAREMREVLASAPAAAPAVSSAPPRAAEAAGRRDAVAAASILEALGGPRNVGDVEAAANRLLVGVADPASVDEVAMRKLGVRGVARTAASRMQLILAEDAAAVAVTIGELVAG